MTKKQKAWARQDAWKQALADGRVIRSELNTLTSFPTMAARDAELVKLRAAGVFASIVQYPAPPVIETWLPEDYALTPSQGE